MLIYGSNMWNMILVSRIDGCGVIENIVGNRSNIDILDVIAYISLVPFLRNSFDASLPICFRLMHFCCLILVLFFASPALTLQLRNKDAALRSRERKKLYVKELEMKSKYYEEECRRLESVVATKPSPAIITTVVSAWSFLLTTMDLLAMRKRWSGDMLNGQDLILISKSSVLQGPGPNARVVYIDGGFDLFHAGHVEILKNARQLGDFLLVGIYTDLLVSLRRVQDILEETTFRLIQKISSLSGENHFRKETDITQKDEKRSQNGKPNMEWKRL
ncbi:ethanolamine-phosphate cytidylyltransferase-like protein [Tanacetum coccineum]